MDAESEKAAAERFQRFRNGELIRTIYETSDHLVANGRLRVDAVTLAHAYLDRPKIGVDYAGGKDATCLVISVRLPEGHPLKSHDRSRIRRDILDDVKESFKLAGKECPPLVFLWQPGDGKIEVYTAPREQAATIPKFKMTPEEKAEFMRIAERERYLARQELDKWVPSTLIPPGTVTHKCQKCGMMYAGPNSEELAATCTLCDGPTENHVCTGNSVTEEPSEYDRDDESLWVEFLNWRSNQIGHYRAVPPIHEDMAVAKREFFAVVRNQAVRPHDTVTPIADAMKEMATKKYGTVMDQCAYCGVMYVKPEKAFGNTCGMCFTGKDDAGIGLDPVFIKQSVVLTPSNPQEMMERCGSCGVMHAAIPGSLNSWCWKCIHEKNKADEGMKAKKELETALLNGFPVYGVEPHRAHSSGSGGDRPMDCPDSGPMILFICQKCEKQFTGNSIASDERGYPLCHHCFIGLDDDQDITFADLLDAVNYSNVQAMKPGVVYAEVEVPPGAKLPEPNLLDISHGFDKIEQAERQRIMERQGKESRREFVDGSNPLDKEGGP